MKNKQKLITFLGQILLLAVLISACAAPASGPTEPPVEKTEPTATAAVASPAPETAAEETAVPETAAVPVDSIDGTWEGNIDISGQSLGIKVVFTTEAGVLKAKLDIAMQSLYDYDLVNVTFDPPSISFEGFEEVGGKAVWSGELGADGKISGDFEQLGYKGTFELSKVDEAAAAQATQTALEALPYATEEVSIQNGEITLGGTLSIPAGEGPFPAVVLISGSGAQNRDEDIYGFKIFGVIADHLTREGIAVLRYDDRGVGASTGDIVNATSNDFAGDAVAWVQYLKTRPEINPAAIGLFGHSEGGIVAPLAAQQSEDIAFLVLMAGTAQTGEQITYEQVELLSRATGLSDAEIEENLALQRRIFDGLLRDVDWDGAVEALRQEITDQITALSDAEKAALGDTSQYIDTAVEQQLSTLQSAWYKYFLTYDPLPVLEQTTLPVLALFGELDLQVPADPNAALMQNAFEEAENPDATVITYPKANHLFQEAITGNPDEYATLEPGFVDGFLEDITAWIHIAVSQTGG
jgi:pimeloyl-ACP methyl ester carboxylesterase